MQYKKAEYFDAIEQFIDRYKDSNGGSTPSTTEIAAGIGLAQSTVSKYLKVMREQGIVDCGGYRNIRTRRSILNKQSYSQVPVLGDIACGIPKFAQENIEEYVNLPTSLFGRGDFFFLRAKGYSMIDAGIDDGDLILVRQQNTADYNQIVVALIEDEATLKRYRPHPDGTIHLHPENTEMDDIIVYPGECLIQGVAVKILKDVR